MSDRVERMDIDNGEASQVNMRGRGFTSKDDGSIRRRRGDRTDEDSVDLVPQRSVEGWILIVRHVNPETDEESLAELFSEYGIVKNLHLNLDRRTGFVKGYAFVEYEPLKEAQTAISEGKGSKLYEQLLQVDFAFAKTDESATRRLGDRRRDRSLSPGR